MLSSALFITSHDKRITSDYNISVLYINKSLYLTSHTYSVTFQFVKHKTISQHLYLSIGLSLFRSACPSVHPSVRPSVRPCILHQCSY